MKELFGNEIHHIYISDDGRFIVFIGAIDFHPSNYWVYDLEDDKCCSPKSWIQDINNPENLLRERIIGIEKKQDIEEGDITIYGYTLKTLKGYTDFEFRNDTIENYGGICELVPHAKLIFPDIEGRPCISKAQILWELKMPIFMTLGRNTESIKLYPYDHKKE